MLNSPEIGQALSSSRNIALFADGSEQNEVVYETAVALIELCQETGSDKRIFLLDPYASRRFSNYAKMGVSKISPFDYEHFTISNNILGSTLSVSRLWLQDLNLIVICEPIVHGQLGLSSILLAQAKLLIPYRGLGKLWVKEHIYKAHELLRCDLGIVCGHKRKGQTESDPFWFISSSDFGLEKEVAGACNVQYEKLPHIKFCSRHAYVHENDVKADGAPLVLEGYAENYPPKIRYLAVAGTMKKTANAIESTLVSAYNLRKAPKYILKKLRRK